MIEHNKKGYTVVETLLFLAISGVMFLLAIVFISGKQHKAEFKQGLNETNSAIRQVINDVDNGTFQSNGEFTCDVDSGASSGPKFTNVPNPQGTNKKCIFLGKVIHFGPQGTNDKGYNVYTIAGRQYQITFDPTGKLIGPPSINFDSAIPTLVPSSTAPSLTQKNTFPWGLQIIKAFSVGDVNNPIGSTTDSDLNGVGFFSDFYNTGSGTLQSGSQGVIVIPIPGTNPSPPVLRGEDEGGISGDILTQVTNKTAAGKYTVTLCFDSGTGQYGTIIIGGGNGQRLTTKTQIYNAKPGVC